MRKIIIIIFTISFFSCDKEINEKDFNIQEIESINEIIMTDKYGGKLVLTKLKDHWLINDTFIAWNEQIEYTLNVMKDIRIKSSVPESFENFAMESIRTNGVKIEIFKNNESLKTYYIGGNTRDHLGTYMIKEGSKNPYIMHIPNRHPGILNPKYGLQGNKVNPHIWRKPINISISSSSISSVKVRDYLNVNQSFTIYNQTDKFNDTHTTLEVYNLNSELVKTDFNKASEYINSFSDLKCGKYKPSIEKSQLRLIKKISINQESTIDSLLIFDNPYYNENNKQFHPNIEILFASYNNSDLVIIQKNIFNKVLITLDDLK